MTTAIKRGRFCAHLGDRKEFRAGCATGRGCRHECLLEEVTGMPEVIPNDDCEECDHYVARADPVVIVTKLSPGDDVVFTAAVESLCRQYPDTYNVAVRSPYPDLWLYNPRVVPEKRFKETPKVFTAEYPLIHVSNDMPVHFMHGFCVHLGMALKAPVPLLVNKPYVYLSAAEKKAPPLVEGEYWLVNAGHKSDFTAKWWGTHNYQAVVNLLRDKVRFVQVGDPAEGHNHPPLDGVTDLRGKTTLRDLVRLAAGSAGGLGPSTVLQHLCAAFDRPYVLVAGGREPRSWQEYPRQTMFSEVGRLDCCREKSCWVSRTLPLGDKSEHDTERRLCKLPVLKTEGYHIPACLDRIRPESVADAVLMYS